jgi:PAS domain S-box-containing protein
MSDTKKTKNQLIKELSTLKKRVQELETSLSASGSGIESFPTDQEQRSKLLDIADVILVVLSSDQTIRYINRQGSKILEYEPHELIGKNWFDTCIPEDIRDGVRTIFEQLMTGEIEPVEFFENPVVTKSGDKKLIDWHNTVTRDNEGNIAGAISSGKDITEFERIGEDLLSAQRSKTIGILASGIGHDLNNILTAVLGNITLTKLSGTLEEEELRRLNEAENAAFSAKQLVTELLSFAEGVEFILSTPITTELIRSTVKLALRGSNVKSEFTLPNGLWPIKFSTNRFIQAISTLIIHARKDMHEGGVIRINARNVTPDMVDNIPLLAERYMELFINFSGVDLPDEHFLQLFDNTITDFPRKCTPEVETIYSVIKTHGGYVNLASEKATGTILSIYFPASDEVVKALEKEPESMISGEGKILLMDDDEMVLNTTGILLEHLGYEVVFAKDGFEALEKYKQSSKEGQPFDVVILDLTIPGGMGGKLTLQKLQEFDSGVKAILSSGYFSDPTIRDFDKYGFRDTVKKPYNIRELSQVLHNVIKTPAE